MCNNTSFTLGSSCLPTCFIVCVSLIYCWRCRFPAVGGYLPEAGHILNGSLLIITPAITGMIVSLYHPFYPIVRYRMFVVCIPIFLREISPCLLAELPLGLVSPCSVG